MIRAFKKPDPIRVKDEGRGEGLLEMTVQGPFIGTVPSLQHKDIFGTNKPSYDRNILEKMCSNIVFTVISSKGY